MAVGFNASGDYAKYVGSPAITLTGDTDKMTIAGWMKIRDITPGQYSYPFGIEDADADSSQYALLGYSDTNTFMTVVTGSNNNFSAQPAQDTWYYFYITIENNGSGYLSASAGYYTAVGTSPVETQDSNLFVEFNPIRICVGNDSWDEWLDSVFAYVRVWTGVALTDTELRAERDSTTAVRTSGLWADWPLADNTDTGDDSGNGHTLSFGGTLTTETGPLAVSPTINATDGISAIGETVNISPLSGADLSISIDPSDQDLYISDIGIG